VTSSEFEALRALEDLSQQLSVTLGAEELVQQFSQSLRVALGASRVEIWHQEGPPERVSEQSRRAAAEARRLGRAVAYVDDEAPEDRRFGLVTPCQRSGPAPELAVFTAAVAFGEQDLLLVRLAAALLEAALHYQSAALDLRESQAQLHQSERMNSIGQLAGGVAHDFNNTLMAISAAAEVMSDTLPEDHPCTPHLALIINTSQRAAQLTQKLLAFSRKARLSTQIVDLHEVLGGVRELLAHALDRRITLQMSLADGACLVEADPTQLQNALLNICLNAKDAMPEGGLLRISTERIDVDSATGAAHGPDVKPGRYVRIEVRDNGTGMDEATLQRAFDPFFTTKEPGRGTGLGLSLVFGAVREHRGSVSLESRVGQGTLCAILLPLLERTRPTSEGARPGMRPNTGRRILLLDDEPGVCRTAAQLLRQLGHNVQALRSGERALSHLRTHHNGYDLIVLDVMMPHPTGVEVYQTLLEDGITVPTIFVSGYHDPPVLDGVLDTAGVVFLQKPFRQADLADAIARCLESCGRTTAIPPPQPLPSAT